jgi:acyl-CoA thioesterase FadM
MSAILSERPVTNENEVEAIPFPLVPLVYLRPQQQPKTFHHSIDVYLKDSNATGNIYFARHFEWQGICRERWFFECISADMLQSLGVFITKEAQQQYVCETFAFQKIECEVNTFAVKQCSFSLAFRFLVEGKLVATGHQQIVFANKEKKISRLPEHILEKIRQYEIAKGE